MSGVERVTPRARPRGMMEIFLTGSAPGWSMPSSAWPASWKAVRVRSSSGMTMLRAAPSCSFSSASAKSAIVTLSLPRLAASRAASLTRLARSAPVMPGVVLASWSRLTLASMGTPRVWTARIAVRPAASGRPTWTVRSKRPGRSSAGSRISGRLVAPMTITPSAPEKPSISVRIWLSVCSRSSWPPMPPAPPRARPMASISSMKTIDGATLRASSNRSRTREAPTPTIISMNSEALAEK